MQSLNILMTPVGSAGDVFPFIAIGRELAHRGHAVTIITAEPFREFAESEGLAFVGFPDTEKFDAVIRTPEIWHPRKGIQLLLRMVAEGVPGLYECIAAADRPGRTLLVGHTIAFGARVYQEKHGTPAVTLHLAPAVFRSDFLQPVHLPGRDMSSLPRPIKRAAWWCLDRFALDPHIVPALNRFRTALGLTPVKRPFHNWIHSPQRVIGLFPEWFGAAQPDWPEQHRLTGFPLFNPVGENASLAPELDAYVHDGAAPIAFTPGSANRQAPAFFAAAVEAASRLERRILLVTPYREQLPAQLPEHVTHVPFAPFGALFPHCAAVVHHGGIGTCAQALAAARPQLVMPMGFDQPDNAARLRRLGVGAWLEPRRFTGANVAAALRTLLDSPGVAGACAHWSREARSGDAVGDAAGLIEQTASGL